MSDLKQVLEDLVADWQAQADRWANPVAADAPFEERKRRVTGAPPSAHELLEACADQLGEVLRTREMPVTGLPGQVVQLQPLRAHEIPDKDVALVDGGPPNGLDTWDF